MLKLRILTALVLLPVVLAIILLAPLKVFDAVVGVALILLAVEYAALCRLSRSQGLAYAALVAMLFVAAVWPWQYAAAIEVSALTGATALWLAALVLLATRSVLPDIAKLLLGLFVIVGAGVALHGLKQLAPDGRWVLMAFLIVWAADVGGYVAGRLFGRHKLAPSISPGKTWEGLVGGVVLVLAAGFVAATWLVEKSDYFAWLLLLLGVAIVSVIGDLVESLLKRQAGVKDSGRLLPGHGGLLDRLDSLLAVAPVFLVAAAQIGIFGELSGIGQ